MAAEAEAVVASLVDVAVAAALVVEAEVEVIAEVRRHDNSKLLSVGF